MSGRRRVNSRTNQTENRATSLVDALAEFERFRTELLPALQQDILSGMDAREIMKKYAAHAVGSILTTALVSADAGQRIAAAKFCIDHAAGKASEHKVLEHRLKDLDENQLDSLILSQLKSADEEDEKEAN